MMFGCNKAKGEQQPAPPPPTLDALERPPLDRYCDLILQGGVVDGVIYPGALIELARHYRFQSIAGTSVGAIAASLAAACEFARRFGSDDGFNEVLRKIPQELAKPSPSQRDATKLKSLFQPEATQKRLFNFLVNVLAVPRSKMPSAILLGLLKYYWFALIAGPTWVVTIYAVLPTSSVGAGWFALVSAVLVILVALGFMLWHDYRKLATSDGFGFCGGLSTELNGEQGLVEWLHEGIQASAKLPLTRPLTFGDLWEAPGGPQDNKARGSRSIDLRMVSSCVSHGRPYEFPHDPNSTRLFFRKREFDRYFPKEVITHLLDVAKPYTEAQRYEGVNHQPARFQSPHPPQPGDLLFGDLYELPVADLPILVATRLSMNFPILFKAVPLWAIDEERGNLKERNGEFAPVFKRAWFSDGGITANFPVHFFDAALPGWPTFGITIATRSRDHKYEDPDVLQLRTWLPQFHTTGSAEKWLEVFCNNDLKDPDFFRRPEKGVKSLSPVAGFWSYVEGIATTAKDWANNANLRMPGVRDRVVFVYKNDDTNGGLNLKLQGDSICKLGYVNGTEAGTSLVEKFLTDSKPFNQKLAGTPGWLDHRWIRLNVYVTALKKHLQGFAKSAETPLETASIREQIAQSQTTAPLRFEKFFEPMLNSTQAQALTDAVTAIEELEAALAIAAAPQPCMPSPQPTLQMRPGL